MVIFHSHVSHYQRVGLLVQLGTIRSPLRWEPLWWNPMGVCKSAGPGPGGFVVGLGWIEVSAILGGIESSVCYLLAKY